MIRRARRDGREARGNEEREKRDDEKGSHCFFKSSGYITSWSSSIKIWFFQTYRMHYLKKDMSWCETNAKICAIDEN